MRSGFFVPKTWRGAGLYLYVHNAVSLWLARVRSSMLRILLALLLLGSWLPTRAARLAPAGPAPITIAAAADLKYVLDSLVTIFNRQHPQGRATVVYGSSGKFYEQLPRCPVRPVFFGR